MGLISKTNISNGNIIQAQDILNIVEALDGTSTTTTIIATGSLSGSLRGSLTGTASYASAALTASYVLSASYATSASISNTSISASNASTASFVLSSSYATSASNALTASFALNAGSSFPFTGSAIISGSIGVTGSFSIQGVIYQSHSFLDDTGSPYAISTLKPNVKYLCDCKNGNVVIDVDNVAAENTSYEFIHTLGPNNKVIFNKQITTLVSRQGYTEMNRTGSFANIYYYTTDDAVMYGVLDA